MNCLMVINNPSLKKFNFSQRSGDSSYHELLIKQIRNNKHRFVYEFKPFLFNSDFCYPQLYHWILSYVKDEKLYAVNWYLNLFLIILQITCLLSLCFAVKYIFGVYLSVTDILWAVCIYIATPFFYDRSNAKNVALSTRQIGVTLGQYYLLFLFIFSIDQNLFLLVPLVIIASLAILGSQFALQYILFCSLIFSIFLKTIFPMLVVTVSSIVIMFIFKDYFRHFLKYQWKHKQFYYKVLAKKFILKLRYSIWRDFYWDFWRRSVNKSWLLYVYQNPVVKVFLGFPFIFLLIPYFWIFINHNYFFEGDNIPEILHLPFHLIIPILVSVLIFLITSFRKTRFLGEPHRYFEFSAIFIALLAVPAKKDYLLLFIACGGLNIFSLISQYILNKNIAQQSDKLNKIIELIVSALNDLESSKKIALFSNNLNITKRFLHSGCDVFWGNVTGRKVGEQYDFDDVFEKYPIVKNSYIMELIDFFKTNIIIIDTSIPGAEEFFNRNSRINKKLIIESMHLKLFEVIF
ncbi:hypothetical protein D1BOALGB6SA_9892 [Olavius sp. associated proteobacterium Delta 1]|nr:hypothetical protein D1BOALGB6SA_9892 [Olavius sp. associated proteobacterium Delta 1]